ncbi:MAG: hypothetical protein AAF585_06590 [Verrucomicrobiota bacterium]
MNEELKAFLKLEKRRSEAQPPRLEPRSHFTTSFKIQAIAGLRKNCIIAYRLAGSLWLSGFFILLAR